MRTCCRNVIPRYSRLKICATLNTYTFFSSIGLINPGCSTRNIGKVTTLKCTPRGRMLANHPFRLLSSPSRDLTNVSSNGEMLFGFAALIVIPDASGGQAENWSEFRGPTGQGHSTARNLPLEWRSDSDGPATNIVWRQSSPGKGWSSPVFYDGRVYLTSAVGGGDGSNLSLRAICVSAGDGRILWNAEVFSHKSLAHIHTKNSHASPTPVVEGNRLYVHFGHNGMACLDLGGSIVWRNTSIVYEPVHGSGRFADPGGR